MFTFEPTQHGVLDAKRIAGHRTLTLRVRNLKLGKDGYARGLVAMIVDKTPIHSTIVDIDDAKERHAFALDLYGTKQRKGVFGADIQTAFPQEDFEQEFMVWARTAWNAYIGASSGAYIKGDESRSAPPWAIPALVMEGSTGIWAGDAGANKSTMMRLACQSLTYGRRELFAVRGEEPSIWINAEESPEEHTRQLGNINEALGMPRQREMFTIHARGMGITDIATRLEKAVREMEAKHVFIDSLSRLAHGMSLNDNNTATLLVDSIAGAAPKCSVNWIGHTGWGNRERLAGSRHFENAARVMVLVQSRIKTDAMDNNPHRGVRTRVTKANGAGPDVFAPRYWQLDYDAETGIKSASKSTDYEWPTLYCDMPVGEAGKERACGRATWDGVMPDRTIRCYRHRGEDSEP